MPGFSDDLYLGSALVPVPPGVNPPGTAPGFNANYYGGVGPLGRVFTYDITPAALNATGICASQTVGAGASALINGALASGGAVTLDVPRALQMVAAAGNTSNVTVTGTDAYGQRQTETRALNGATPVNLTKAFRTVTSVVSAGAITTFTLGTRDVFGLPYRVTDAGYIVHVGWDNTLARNAGTLAAADTTSPATATTNDVRGTYAPAGSAANGTRRLIVVMALPGIAAGPNATLAGAIGVTPA